MEHTPDTSWKRDMLANFIGFLNGAGFIIKRGDEPPEGINQLISRYLDDHQESGYEFIYFEDGRQKGRAHLNREIVEKDRNRILYGQ